MALSGKYVSLFHVLEKVYDRTGYQQIDWASALEVAASTLRLIGAVPAFKDIVTNGLGTNSGPLQIIDYKALLPTDLLDLRSARYVELVDDVDSNNDPIKRISNMIPMVESTDLFAKSPLKKQSTSDISPATYDYIDITADNAPVIVEDSKLSLQEEYIYGYKLNDSYMFTNFEVGFVELTYTGFATDDHGYPMIPDNERFIKAIMWAIIEDVDYKAWRKGIISERVYRDSEQNALFYVGSAKNAANIPSIDKMESIKNLLVRSIKKTDFHNDYFKYANVGEKRWNDNS